MKNIATFVLRNNLGDATNSGLTSREDRITLHYGEINKDEVNDNDLVLIERVLWGEQCNYAVPGSIYKSDKHSMFGGNFIYTSDSRFPSDAPIKVHDRVEY